MSSNLRRKGDNAGRQQSARAGTARDAGSSVSMRSQNTKPGPRPPDQEDRVDQKPGEANDPGGTKE